MATPFCGFKTLTGFIAKQVLLSTKNQRIVGRRDAPPLNSWVLVCTSGLQILFQDKFA
jgi:hypothetical protein